MTQIVGMRVLNIANNRVCFLQHTLAKKVCRWRIFTTVLVLIKLGTFVASNNYCIHYDIVCI